MNADQYIQRLRAWEQRPEVQALTPAERTRDRMEIYRTKIIPGIKALSKEERAKVINAFNPSTVDNRKLTRTPMDHLRNLGEGFMDAGVVNDVVAHATGATPSQAPEDFVGQAERFVGGLASDLTSLGGITAAAKTGGKILAKEGLKMAAKQGGKAMAGNAMVKAGEALAKNKVVQSAVAFGINHAAAKAGERKRVLNRLAEVSQDPTADPQEVKALKTQLREMKVDPEKKTIGFMDLHKVGDAGAGVAMAVAGAAGGKVAEALWKPASGVLRYALEPTKDAGSFLAKDKATGEIFKVAGETVEQAKAIIHGMNREGLMSRIADNAAYQVAHTGAEALGFTVGAGEGVTPESFAANAALAGGLKLPGAVAKGAGMIRNRGTRTVEPIETESAMPPLETLGLPEGQEIVAMRQQLLQQGHPPEAVEAIIRSRYMAPQAVDPRYNTPAPGQVVENVEYAPGIQEPVYPEFLGEPHTRRSFPEVGEAHVADPRYPIGEFVGEPHPRRSYPEPGEPHVAPGREELLNLGADPVPSPEVQAPAPKPKKGKKAQEPQPPAKQEPVQEVDPQETQDKILTLSDMGYSNNEISGYLREAFGVEITPDEVGRYIENQLSYVEGEQSRPFPEAPEKAPEPVEGPVAPETPETPPSRPAQEATRPKSEWGIKFNKSAWTREEARDPEKGEMARKQRGSEARFWLEARKNLRKLPKSERKAVIQDHNTRGGVKKGALFAGRVRENLHAKDLPYERLDGTIEYRRHGLDDRHITLGTRTVERMKEDQIGGRIKEIDRALARKKIDQEHARLLHEEKAILEKEIDRRANPEKQEKNWGGWTWDQVVERRKELQSEKYQKELNDRVIETGDDSHFRDYEKELEAIDRIEREVGYKDPWLMTKEEFEDWAITREKDPPREVAMEDLEFDEQNKRSPGATNRKDDRYHYTGTGGRYEAIPNHAKIVARAILRGEAVPERVIASNRGRISERLKKEGPKDGLLKDNPIHELTRDEAVKQLDRVTIYRTVRGKRVEAEKRAKDNTDRKRYVAVYRHGEVSMEIPLADTPKKALEFVHRAEVEAALKQGREVPESVLKDYPDLKGKVASGTPIEEAPKTLTPEEIEAQIKSTLRSIGRQKPGKKGEIMRQFLEQKLSDLEAQYKELTGKDRISAEARKKAQEIVDNARKKKEEAPVTKRKGELDGQTTMVPDEVAEKEVTLKGKEETVKELQKKQAKSSMGKPIVKDGVTPTGDGALFPEPQGKLGLTDEFKGQRGAAPLGESPFENVGAKAAIKQLRKQLRKAQADGDAKKSRSIRNLIRTIEAEMKGQTPKTNIEGIPFSATGLNPKTRQYVEAATSGKPDADLYQQIERDVANRHKRANDTMDTILEEGIPGASGEKYAKGVNLDTVDDGTPEGSTLRKAVEFAANMNSTAQVERSRRGKMSHEDTLEMATLLGMKVEDLLSRPIGQAYNAESVASAKKLLMESAKAVHDYAKKIEGGEDSTVNRMHLIRAIQAFNEVHAQFAGMRAEAGRALDAFKIPVGEKMNVKAMRDYLERMGENEVTMDQIRLLSELDPTNPEFALQARKLTQAKGQSAIIEFLRNSMLSALPTHAVNTIANSMYNAQLITERAGAGAVGHFKATLKGYEPGTPEYLKEAPVGAGEAMEMLYAVPKAWADAVAAAKYTFRTEQTTGLVSLEGTENPAIHFDTTGKRANFLREHGVKEEDVQALAKGINTTGYHVRTPERALKAMDEFMKVILYRQEINAQVYRQARGEGLTGEAMTKRMAELEAEFNRTAPEERDPLMQEWDASAKKYALYGTFAKPLKEGDFLTQVGKHVIQLKMSDNPAVAGPTSLLAMFVKTPVNVTKAAGERVPVLSLLSQEVRDSLSGKKGKVEQQIALGKQAFGMGVVALTSSLFLNNAITGTGPADPNVRKSLERAGWQERSIKIGDKWVSYERFGHFGILLGSIADFYEIAPTMGKVPATKAAARIMSSVMKNVLSQNYLKGLTDVSAAISDPLRYGQQYLLNLTSSAVPNILAYGTKVVDPDLREANTIFEKWRSRTPWGVDGLNRRRDLWGDPIRSEMDPKLSFVLPTRIKSSHAKSKIDAEMADLNLSFGPPGSKIAGIELSPDEHEFYATQAGRRAKKILDAMVATQAWDRLPRERKADRIEDVFNRSRKIARRELVAKFPELRKRLRGKEEVNTGNKATKFEGYKRVLEKE